MKTKVKRINRLIGEMLRDLRKLDNETQEQFGKRLGLSQQQYARLEAGQSAAKVADFFEWARLLNWEPQEMFNSIAIELKDKKGKKR